MSKRYQPERQSIAALNPSAAPVNRLVQPQAPAQTVGESELTQLAKALSGIQPTITNFMVNEMNRNDEESAAKAREMRAKTMLNYKEAVKQGIITVDQNPFFTKAWKEQDGSVAADQYNSDLTVALSVGPFAASRDQVESDKLFRDFRTKWMEKYGVGSEDSNYVESFNRKANGYDMNARTTQANRIGDRQVADTINNTYHEALGVFDDAEQRELAPTATALGLNVLADRLVSVGLDPRQVNSVLIDAAVAKARETKSIAVFDVLDSVKTGSGYLGRTVEAKTKRDQIEDEINRDLEQADRTAWDKRIKARTILEQEASSSIFTYIHNQRKNGEAIRAQDVEPLLAQLGAVDWRSAEALRDVITESQKERWTDDSDTVYRLQVLDQNKTLTVRDITASFIDHKLTDDTARLLTDRVERRERQAEEDAERKRNGKKALNIANDDSFQEMFANIKRIYGETMGVSMGPDKAAALNKALSMAGTIAQDWRDRNPDTTILEDRQKAKEIYENVILGTAKDVLGNSVDVQKLTKDQVLPNSTTPKAFEQLTAPVMQPGMAKRFANNRLEWLAMKEEYMRALEDPAGDPLSTPLGQTLDKLGISYEEVLDALSAQDSLYTDEAPKLPRQ